MSFCFAAAAGFGALLLLLSASALACRVSFSASDLADRTQGANILGPEGSASRFGNTVSPAGDVNGDGYDDVMIAASDADKVFLVFGRSAAEWASADLSLTLGTPANGSSWIAVSHSLSSCSSFGQSALASGDWNGDGFSDFAIGMSGCRTAVVVYGHSGTWSNFDTSEVSGNGAVAGFFVNGALGYSDTHVGNAGDMNGDGIEDLLFSEQGLSTSSASYVLFGLPGTDREDVAIGNYVNGTTGFELSASGIALGIGIFGSAGDINGDGLADLLVGGKDQASSNGGQVFVLFARSVANLGAWPLQVSLKTLDSTEGIIIKDVYPFRAVGAGDINNDGSNDIYIGADNPVAGCVVFSGTFSSPFSLSEINGTNGFCTSGTVFGPDGGGAGDFNGDGIADLAIGGVSASNAGGTTTGVTLAVYGHQEAWPTSLFRSTVKGSTGFQIEGIADGNNFGRSSCGAGDVNGDGISDLIIGAPLWWSSRGHATIVFGVADDHCAVCSNTTGACLVCDDGFILNGTICEAEPSAPFVSSTAASSASVASSSFPSSPSSSAHQQGVSVVVIINFLDNVTDPTELEEEIASVLGIDAGLVSVVVISPTEVEVTIIGSEETAQRLVDIINGGGTGSDGSGLGLLRKAIDAHIRKDTDGEGSSDDGVDAAPRVALLQSALLATVTFSVMAL